MAAGTRARMWALIAMAVQLLALLRCLGEYYRQKQVFGTAFEPTAMEPFILGATVAALCTSAGFAAFAWGRFRICVVIAGLMVAALLAIKFTMLGN